MIIILYILLIILVLAAIVGLYQKNTNAICKSKKRLDDKTTLITGGTAGMGLQIAIDFANRGARVIVACPFPEEGANALKTIIGQTGNKNVAFKLLNLASLDSVRQFSSDILKDEDRLDILINNAGIGKRGGFTTKDGLNFLMQVNYFGQFLLTLLLLPLLRKTGKPREPSRIVNTASNMHHLGIIDLENINNSGHWYEYQIYSNSKLALILFARELTDRLKDVNVVVNSVDPGAVGTNIFKCYGTIGGALMRLLLYSLSKTPWEGAQTAVHVALDKEAGEMSGQFFRNCKVTSANHKAYNEKTAKILWNESVRLVKISEDELLHCFKDM